MNAGPGTFRVSGNHWIVFRNRCEGGMAKLVNMGNRRAARGSGGEPQRDLRPSRSEAEDAVRTLIRWAGDDPDREGLRGTPGRVVRAYEAWRWGWRGGARAVPPPGGGARALDQGGEPLAGGVPALARNPPGIPRLHLFSWIGALRRALGVILGLPGSRARRSREIGGAGRGPH